ncbi:hypothetical protein [Haloferula sp. BvORR071]|uniref:hypothetical protein n=1 Tax=Haloferula sp. BvORR071 TaxID=1396141 RepID=UPI002240EFF5|nr:hypothetical protein [Haloferula sp. BvORR071]
MAAKTGGEASKQGIAGNPATPDETSPSKSGKSGARPTAPKPASDKEQEKFKRFFLPPIKLEGATIEEAVAAIVAAYRETATATGETALDLRVDLASARTRKPLTCTTPRAPAGTVLRYVAAMAGNSTKGSLPNFRLEALSDVADRKGKMEVPPDWASQVADLLTSGTKASEAKLAEDPFAETKKKDPPQDDPFSENPPRPRPNLRDLLIAQGFNPELVCAQSGPSFTYEHMSEAEQELLAALAETGGLGGLGPVQLKIDAKVIELPEDLAHSLNSGAALTDAEVQLTMRELAQKKGVDLMTLPSITARAGEDAMIELINTKPTQEGGETWTGVKLATTAVPYGLGSQVEFAFKGRGEGGDETLAREQVTLPENANGVALSQANGGQKLVVMVGNTLIDAIGRPIAPPP